jgi:hypothetical protein
MIANEQNINKIIMKPTAITLCDIGNDWYKNNLEIHFEPDKYYPDYMKVEKWIMEKIDGERLNIEEVVNNVYEMLMRTYKPHKLKIIDVVTGNKVHFDVTVIKQSD